MHFPSRLIQAAGRLIWRILRFLLLLWVALFLLQRYIIYRPTQDSTEVIAAEARSLGFKPWRGSIGYCSLAPTNDPRPPLSALVVHGNAGSAIDRAEFAFLLREAMPHLAISVYILEYPGYGARQGKPSQQNFLAAGIEAFNQVPQEPIIILGESIGTGVACALAAAHPEQVSGLILLTPFDSLANVARQKIPILPTRWLLLDQFPSHLWLQDYQGPVAIIVAAKDSVIPPQRAHKLYEGYTGPKKLIEVPEADHNDITGQLSIEDWKSTMEFIMQNRQ
jgi:pimeloyl-ACP methyl ester carboxylesterase